MNNFDTVKDILRTEINTRVILINTIDAQISDLLKQKEEHELVMNEVQEAIKKLASDNS